MNKAPHTASRTLSRAVFLVVVIALAYFGYRWFTRSAPVPVVLERVGRGRVERTVANTRAGTVKACHRSKLSPTTGGQIVQLKVKEGDRVQAGQVLLELWNADTSAQLKAAEDQAVAARAREKEACLAAEIADREAQRAVKLQADGLIPFEKYDQVTSEAKTRRASCEAAHADVQARESQIKVASAAQERTVLKAPYAGIVAKVTGELGEVATPSPPGIPTPPAIDLIDDSCLYVTAPIDEVDTAAVRVGMAGRITLDAFPGRQFAGRVRRIAPYVLELEKQARTVDVDVEFLHPEEARALLVGYSADAEIVLEVRENVLRVPTQALLPGNRVMVYDPASGTLAARSLRTGLSNWEFTEVLEGLNEGERIVTSLQREGVAAGAHVIPEEPSAVRPKP